MVAVKTGGITSFAAIWLVIVPLEAALSASRRVVATASTLALLAAGLLILCNMYHLLPTPATPEQGEGALAALGIISAALYSTGLALGAESLARVSFWLRYAEEDRYRLLARNMTDVITRHGCNGIVLFASPAAAERLFGATVAELLGHGLFDRVHVAGPVRLSDRACCRPRRRPVGRVPVRRDRSRCGGASRQRVHLDRDALPSARRLARRRRRDARS